METQSAAGEAGTAPALPISTPLFFLPARKASWLVRSESQFYMTFWLGPPDAFATQDGHQAGGRAAAQSLPPSSLAGEGARFPSQGGKQGWPLKSQALYSNPSSVRSQD